jgi:rRNA maturation RNase YbeY
MNKVRFNYADISPIPLSGKRKVKAFVSTMFQLEGKELQEINYIFCSDNYLLEMNERYLNHDDLTDIITFDLSGQNGTIGEVYISNERVKENSASHNCSYREEILRVVFHGALHLCGYKDKKKSEITEMRGKEDHYLNLYLKSK